MDRYVAPTGEAKESPAGFIISTFNFNRYLIPAAKQRCLGSARSPACTTFSGSYCPTRLCCPTRWSVRRLTVVTDSINTGSLYGGVGTALILAALTARRLGASLRLVDAEQIPDLANVRTVLDIHGIAWDDNIECVMLPATAPLAAECSHLPQ